MKTHPRCAPCLLSRVQFEAELSTKDLELQKKQYLQVSKCCEDTWLTALLRIIFQRRYTGKHTRFWVILTHIEKKKQSNEAALALLPFAREFVYEKD